MISPTFYALIAFVILAQGHAFSSPQSQQVSDTTVVDTAWVDSASPVFTPTALLRLNQYWSSRNYRGVCLRGEVRVNEAVGAAAHVTHVFSAAFPNLCTGYKNIGAALFLYEAEESESEAQTACDLLRGHPEWAMTAVVTGIETRKLRNTQGRTVITAAAPVASYCAWLRKEEERPEQPPKPD